MKLQSQAFTTAGTHPFSVPAGVSCLWLKMVGGGGSGLPFLVNEGGGVFHGGVSAGGSGGLCMGIPVNVTPGASIDVVVGAGGPAALYPQTVVNYGYLGGASSVAGMRSAGGFPPWTLANGGFSDNLWGSGGGGGTLVSLTIGVSGVRGRVSSVGFFTGASGGGVWNPAGTPNGTVGGPSVNDHAGGSPGAFTVGVTSAGAGGGSSPFGVGGTGGDHTTNPVVSNGNAPAAGAYGAGGGGGGVWGGGAYTAAQPIAGAGQNGYVLVSWVA